MLKIQYKTIDDLNPYSNNSRTHTPEQIQQIARSIKQFGWTNPVLIDSENTIIAGHGRVEAAKLNGDKQVPTIQIQDMTDDQKKAYIIADNKLALNAGWDDEILKIELESLNDADLGLTGFNADELNLLFNGWDSDIGKMNEIDAKDTVNKERILIKCDGEQKQMIWEAVTNAIDNLGLDDVEIS